FGETAGDFLGNLGVDFSMRIHCFYVVWQSLIPSNSKELTFGLLEIYIAFNENRFVSLVFIFPM
ncbi:MAG: hypothetical protein D3909_11835, partial [Candidatus Electrothrix sp. ATG1]|nr:hypothetical protein [Candidatus Electrothrix sp. ATG1]